ncbi:hypothetical protein [Inquilinus limosus]|uniref:hypothetical protein n=1 Tax=Inquilinus limosus TaxID=171674 RepID=UPI00047D32B6|nr:hypothetical protein [Inquilinus limosus]
MYGLTRIEPPISFRRRDGRPAVIGDVNTLAEWLNGLYDAILDPHRPEGERSWEVRSVQLYEIEQVLFMLAEESASDADAISAGLRATCEAVIACYRDLIVTYPPATRSIRCAGEARSLATH